MDSAKNREMLDRAVALHRLNRLDEADALYAQILNSDATNTDALNLRGLVAVARGLHDKALALYGQAITAKRDEPSYLFNRGNAFAAMGRHVEALADYDAALECDPVHIPSLLNRGTLLHKLGRLDEARAAFEALVRLAPKDWRAHFNLGRCLAESNEHERGIQALRRALELNPKNPEAALSLARIFVTEGRLDDALAVVEAGVAATPGHAGLLDLQGSILARLGRFIEARNTYDGLMAQTPNDMRAYYGKASVLHAEGDLDAAESAVKRALQIDPRSIEAHILHGNIVRAAGKYEEAVSAYVKALIVQPDLAEGYHNLGDLYFERRHYAAALLCARRAVELQPDEARFRWNLCLSALRMGQLETGYAHYALRFVFDHPGVRRPEPPVYWSGQDLNGKTIVVWTEQGVGDEILHAGVFNDLADTGAHCIIECTPRMVPVFSRSFPRMRVIPFRQRGVLETPPDQADYQIAAGDLGRYFRRDLAAIPQRPDYLRVDENSRATLRKRYEALAGGRKIVGIAWKSKGPHAGVYKTTDLTGWSDILRTPGIMFVNLQYGDVASDLEAVRAQCGIEIFNDVTVDPLTDMDAHCAQVAAMDLVVSISNAAVHVAGALNIPAWVLLPLGKGSLWYWFTHRTDSPWYPSLRLFRAPDEMPSEKTSWWAEVVPRVSAALHVWVTGPD